MDRNYFKLVTTVLAIALVCSSCKGLVNSNYDSHFGVSKDDDGYLIRDSLYKDFTITAPTSVKFFVEVSGSMNGFFRANKATQFKMDLWRILSFYSSTASEIGVLSNDATLGAEYDQSQFKTMMNTGRFVSSASTKVPEMIQTVIKSLDIDGGEVAVLVSDMKYSPVGSKAPEVLMSQYSTDISMLLNSFKGAVSLVCATSDYLDKKGNKQCETSPYYYLILGKAECVADVRNAISGMLDHEGHFVDNIERGFDFKRARYGFGIPEMCLRLDDQPTFIEYEEASDGDTCTVRLNVSLEDYRWIMSSQEYFSSAFTVKTTYGSQVKVGDVNVDIQNNGSKDRTVTATVALKLYDMATDSEVIEWGLKLPDSDYSLFQPFFDNATQESDPSKSYSVNDFIKGMLDGGTVNNPLSNNYILVSKNYK